MTDRRYSPNGSANLAPKILAMLTDKWVNTAIVCKAIGRRADDGATRYCLKVLANHGEIDRKSAPSRISRTGYAFLFRRKP